jgi:hypothetical protein
MDKERRGWEPKPAYEPADDRVALFPSPSCQYVIAQEQGALEVDGAEQFIEELMLAFDVERSRRHWHIVGSRTTLDSRYAASVAAGILLHGPISARVPNPRGASYVVWADWAGSV